MSIKSSENETEKKPSTNTNLYGKVIVPTILAERCGIDGNNPRIDEDCLKIIAEDYKSNAADTKYSNWEEERRGMIQEQASAYLAVAAKNLVLVGEDSNTIADKTNEGPESSLTITSDVREQIERNNVVANEVATKILDSIDLRSSSIILKNITDLLTETIPSIKTGT